MQSCRKGRIKKEIYILHTTIRSINIQQWAKGKDAGVRHLLRTTDSLSLINSGTSDLIFFNLLATHKLKIWNEIS
jgi:hypothetical protein